MSEMKEVFKEWIESEKEAIVEATKNRRSEDDLVSAFNMDSALNETSSVCSSFEPTFLRAYVFGNPDKSVALKTSANFQVKMVIIETPDSCEILYKGVSLQKALNVYNSQNK